MSISKDEKCSLLENDQQTKWRVSIYYVLMNVNNLNVFNHCVC